MILDRRDIFARPGNLVTVSVYIESIQFRLIEYDYWGWGLVVWPLWEILRQTRHCTTMMLTKVPEFLTQGALVSLLEDRYVYIYIYIYT